jgi:adenylyltransferase/sulfurtransferase
MAWLMSIPFEAVGRRAAAVRLTQEEATRYSRHLILPEVGLEGQKRLKASSVLLVGAGGLGSPVALYLAAAGVGRLGLVDFDVVDFSNLHRQILHGTPDVGRPKLHSARDRIAAVNPEVVVELHEGRLSTANALALCRPYDLVIDGTDNFATRYLVNDVCVLLKKPNVYGSIFRFEGQASVFHPPDSPCYRCLYPEPPPPGEVPSCGEGGVLGVLPGVVGCIQATEAIKLLLGVGTPLLGRFLLYDALAMTFQEFRIYRDPQCPLCGDHPTLTGLIDTEQFCGTRGAPTANDDGIHTTVEELKARLDCGEPVLVLDVRQPEEYQICRLAGSVLIPLGELPGRLAELDRTREIIVHCKGGTRSLKAVQLLREAGFARVKNLQGGILAWARSIDQTLPTH